uniref:Pco079065e n=1 Tax=Arundo donax TaxID=35708 RepID=A0A0A9GVR1_ARUDO
MTGCCRMEPLVHPQPSPHP